MEITLNTKFLETATDNDTFLDGIFPPEQEIIVPVPKDLPYTPNYIVHKNVILYGSQGSGKSENVRKLVEIALERYGENSTNALQVPSGKIELAYESLDDKPIQIVFADDFTLVKHDKETMNKFFMIRHVWNELTSRNNGYIITLMGVHRFHAIQPEFRTNFDFLLLKSSPDGKYDRDFLKAYFNSKFLNLMNLIELGRLKDRELFGYTLWRDKAERQGFLKLGLAKKNYLKEITVPAPAGGKKAVIRTPSLLTEAKMQAFLPKITTEEAATIAENLKTRHIFGPKEILESVEPQFRPLVFVEIKYERGRLRKSFKISSFIIDGLSGALADIERGLVLKRGFEDLLGLNEDAVRTLVTIGRAERATVAELMIKTGLTESAVRESIESLSKRRGLITYTKIGRAKVYVLHVKLTLPSLDHRVTFEPPAETKISGALKGKFNENDLRNVLKAIEPNCDITKFQVFYYPTYHAHYLKGNTTRTTMIDGLTARELRI